MIKKVIYITIGILLIILALIFALGVIGYSLKEDDKDGYSALFISAILIAVGIYSIIKGKRVITDKGK